MVVSKGVKNFGYFLLFIFFLLNMFVFYDQSLNTKNRHCVISFANSTVENVRQSASLNDTTTNKVVMVTTASPISPVHVITNKIFDFSSYVDWNKEYEFSVSDYNYPTSGNVTEILTGVKSKNNSIANVKELNAYSHNILRQPLNSCKETIQILFLIKSAVSHQTVRNTIRTTWGSVQNVNGNKLRYYFVVGLPKVESESKIEANAIERESKAYNDIIQIDSIDTYYNNTLKTLGAMKFVVERCQVKPQFLFFADDDFYVNSALLSIFIQKEITGSRHEKLYLGMVVDKSGPDRHKKGKWYVSEEYYKYSLYPPFLRAGAMLMSPDTVEDLFIASSFVKRFVFDDVYLAIIAHELGIQPRNCAYLFVDRIGPKDKRFCKTIASHWYSEKDIREAWLLSKKRSCF